MYVTTVKWTQSAEPKTCPECGDAPENLPEPDCLNDVCDCCANTAFYPLSPLFQVMYHSSVFLHKT